MIKTVRRQANAVQYQKIRAARLTQMTLMHDKKKEAGTWRKLCISVLRTLQRYLFVYLRLVDFQVEVLFDKQPEAGACVATGRRDILPVTASGSPFNLDYSYITLLMMQRRSSTDTF